MECCLDGVHTEGRVVHIAWVTQSHFSLSLEGSHVFLIAIGNFCQRIIHTDDRKWHSGGIQLMTQILLLGYLVMKYLINFQNLKILTLTPEIYLALGIHIIGPKEASFGSYLIGQSC